MSSRRRFMVTLGTLAGLHAAVGHSARAQDVAAPALTADLDLLEEVMLQLHPGTRRYLSAQSFANGMANLRRDWAATAAAGPGAADPEALRLRALSLSVLLGAVRCGHSYTNFYNQRGAVRTALCEAPLRLPLHFDLLGDEWVVTGAAPAVAARVPVGSTLRSINGRSTSELDRVLLPLVRADGHNPGAQRALLAATGSDTIETFDVLHAMAFGATTVFIVELRTPEGRLRTERLSGITQAQRLAMRPPPPDTLWPLSLTPDGAVFTMPGWAVYDRRIDWKARIAQAFDQLSAARVARLVIDLRGNEGGLDCGDEIIARLIDEPLDADVGERLVRYRRVPEALNAALDTWDDSFRDWGARAQEAGNGFFRLSGGAATRIAPQGPRFGGRVAVLVGGINHSATFRFATLMQRARLGLLVGDTTGGNQRGINGGSFFFLRLPASGLAVDIPLVGVFARGAPPDAGLPPDVAVRRGAEDIVRGHDPLVARAFEAMS